MASGEHSSPLFPPELEREIFETTGELYPETIHKPCLLLIAKRVHECGVQTLTLYGCPVPAILPSLGVMQPRRLTISLGDLFDSAVSIELSHSAFTFVTHLHVWDYLFFNPFLWSQFVLLPALTHLALYGRDESNIISLLSACPKIAVLISMSDDYLTVEERPSVDDARFVWCMELTYGNYLDDWLAGTKGDVDFWVRAERFIAKKRCGEIQPSPSSLDFRC
ncbi:hypothetical protein FB451DRAFT_1390157 [Mycena latifolia]|nr:hypothetical protein FB451DRAFT_1390157 [Mycena latifolia]